MIDEDFVMYINLWNGYDKSLFFKSEQEAIEDKKTALNPQDFIGTYRLVSPEYLETILKQRKELAEQLELMTNAAEIFEAKLNKFEEEKKYVWDMACEAQTDKLIKKMPMYRLINKEISTLQFVEYIRSQAKPEYKP
jgi:hypothetical protein